MTPHEPQGRDLDIYLAHKLRDNLDTLVSGIDDQITQAEKTMEIESEAWYRACAEGRERPCSDRTPTSRARAGIERWISR